MLEGRAGAQVAHFRLHHRAEVARRVMPEVDHLAEIPLEENHHSAPDLCCWNRHEIILLRIE